MATMTKCYETADSELVTEAAVRFRIEKLRKELTEYGADQKRLLGRIQRLKMRLPAAPQGNILPAVPAVMLVSKNNLDWGDKTGSMYN